MDKNILEILLMVKHLEQESKFYYLKDKLGLMGNYTLEIINMICKKDLQFIHGLMDKNIGVKLIKIKEMELDL